MPSATAQHLPPAPCTPWYDTHDIRRAITPPLPTPLYDMSDIRPSPSRPCRLGVAVHIKLFPIMYLAPALLSIATQPAGAMAALQFSLCAGVSYGVLTLALIAMCVGAPGVECSRRCVKRSRSFVPPPPSLTPPPQHMRSPSTSAVRLTKDASLSPS